MMPTDDLQAYFIEKGDALDDLRWYAVLDHLNCNIILNFLALFEYMNSATRNLPSHQLSKQTKNWSSGLVLPVMISVVGFIVTAVAEEYHRSQARVKAIAEATEVG
nr:hypothetical protein [Tanacetum cinerariifolium]